MTTRRRLLQSLGSMAAAPALAAAAAPAFAQGSGAPLRIVVPYPPGGSSDRSARLLAETLGPRLGQPVVVENIVGAGGRLAMRQLAGSGDPNVLVVANPALMVVAPLVYRNNGYDPDRDFQPLAQVSRYEFAIAVGPAVPVREVKHLLAWMKANPDKSNLGVPASGSLPHFFGLMLGQAAAAPVTIVPYKGSAPMISDLVGGHLPVAVDTLDTLVAQHEGGRLRILATSGTRRAVASIPTFAESGIDTTAVGWNVVYAKASMPAPQAERIAAEIAASMAVPALQKAFLDAKSEPVAATRAQTRTMLDAFRARWVPVIRNAGLQFE
ncbi:MAG: tripartite tricarboxylate transporter substrate-binding protein [Pseudomonadota bacterium]|nr:ABC transporter substrate-binding protein [Rubrivivax sp.]MCA3258447.1 ABC transporter substrate-binding protein [Rubrivivax sp.]MCE2911869.1 ABC transporter substrate-binding protein [Rubrivivax sp.]MCZ8031603.1 tripartite tricarboxylate transporter substrate-binding protein [Rubrivivax sp.]